MDPQETVSRIEQRADEVRVSITYICQRAGVHPTTFFRWKRTPKNPDPVMPNSRTLQKIDAALTEIESEYRSRRAKRPHVGKAVAA